jgi:isopropanol dehydrogenase (NADP+)
MADKTIRTGRCSGGSLRMERLLRVLQLRRLDSTKMTTHTFSFEDVDKDFEIIDGKLDGVLKPLIVF